jgi:hypothetical protein
MAIVKVNLCIPVSTNDFSEAVICRWPRGEGAARSRRRELDSLRVGSACSRRIQVCGFKEYDIHGLRATYTSLLPLIPQPYSSCVVNLSRPST